MSETCISYSWYMLWFWVIVVYVYVSVCMCSVLSESYPSTQSKYACALNFGFNQWKSISDDLIGSDFHGIWTDHLHFSPSTAGRTDQSCIHHFVFSKIQKETIHVRTHAQFRKHRHGFKSYNNISTGKTVLDGFFSHISFAQAHTHPSFC